MLKKLRQENVPDNFLYNSYLFVKANKYVACFRTDFKNYLSIIFKLFFCSGKLTLIMRNEINHFVLQKFAITLISPFRQVYFCTFLI